MPQMSPEMLAARLANGKPVPVILLLGGDVYLRDACRDRIVESSVDAAGQQWGVMRYSAADDDFVQIIGHARTAPMLVPRQVLVVGELEAVEQGSEKAREAAVSELAAYLDDPAPYTVLLLEASALDQRMRLAKLLAEKAQVVAAELPEDPQQRAAIAATLASKMARECKAEIDAEATEELVDLCDANLAAIRNEIEKLAAYVGAGQRISRQDVVALVVPEKKSSVWELAEMLASRDRVRALSFLDNLLRDGEQGPAMVGAMAYMYRRLMEVQELGANVSAEQASARLRMRRTTAAIAVRYARKIPRSKLIEGLRALYDADSRLKSGPPDHRAVMEFLVIGLIGTESALKTS